MKRTTITKRPPAQGLLAGTLFILLLLAASCTEADVTRNDNPGQQIEEVETTFDLKVAPSATPMTRSITLTDKGTIEVDTLAVATPASADTLQTRSATELPDAQEKKVAGLWIGQYNAAGTTLLSHQYIESVTGTQVTVRLKAAVNCHVRFVTNAGNLGAIETETLLDEKTLAYASTADGKPQSNLFAMTGTWTGDITKEATSLPLPTGAPAVMLTRLAAKITFTYKINGEGFTFTLTSVTLKNAPDCSQIGELTTQLTTGVTYGAYSGTVSPTGATMYWYLPENMAGTGTPSVNSEKEKTGRGVNNATYIELFGNAVQNGVEYKNVAFRFYPGKDENDYNIKRNDHFIMKLDLKGLDISDKRITVGEIPPITESTTGNLPVTGGSKDIYITSRPGVVWYLTLPPWLSATMNGQITPGGSTLTYQGAGKVTFTAGMNQTAEVRSQTYDIKLDDTRSQSFTIAQEPSTLSLGTPVAVEATPATGTASFTATPGLAWNATSNNADWLATTASGTTTTTSNLVPFSTTATNPLAAVRGGSITVRAGDPALGPTGTISITQAGSTAAGSTVGVVAEPTPGTATFTATPGLPWTATSNAPWITVATPAGGPTVAGNNTVNFNTTATNPQDYVRPGTITVVAGGQPGSPVGTITVNQNPSVFGAAGAGAPINQAGGSSTGSVTATAGLQWYINPATNNGITVSPTNGIGNTMLTFTAPANPEYAVRTGTFTASVAENPGRAIPIYASQDPKISMITITQNTVDLYKEVIKILRSSYTSHPAFWYDGGPDWTKEGDIHGTSSTATLTNVYSIEIEYTQLSNTLNGKDAINYCHGKGDRWRIPTFIELIAMCGDRIDANGLMYGPLYLDINKFYWSSSRNRGNGKGNYRCALEEEINRKLHIGHLLGSDSKVMGWVRCVRDL